MKLVLDKYPIDLSGAEVKGKTLGQLLGESLSGKTPGIDALKAYIWAVDLYNAKELDLDKSDLQKIIQFVENNEVMNNILKGQILNELHAKKEVA